MLFGIGAGPLTMWCQTCIPNVLISSLWRTGAAPAARGAGGTGGGTGGIMDLNGVSLVLALVLALLVCSLMDLLEQKMK